MSRPVPHRSEVLLHSVDTSGNIIDQRETLRVFGRLRLEYSRDNALKLGCWRLLSTTLRRQNSKMIASENH